MPTKILNAWTLYECARCSMAMCCWIGVPCVIVEQKEHVEELDDQVTYWVLVSMRRVQHWDKKRLAMVFDKISRSLWMACHRPRPTPLGASADDSAVQPLLTDSFECGGG